MVYVKCFFCNEKTYKYICKCKHFICLNCRHHSDCHPFCLNLTKEEIKAFHYTDNWVIKYQEELNDLFKNKFDMDLSEKLISNESKLKAIPKLMEIYMNLLNK